MIKYWKEWRDWVKARKEAREIALAEKVTDWILASRTGDRSPEYRAYHIIEIIRRHDKENR